MSFSNLFQMNKNMQHIIQKKWSQMKNGKEIIPFYWKYILEIIKMQHLLNSKVLDREIVVITYYLLLKKDYLSSTHQSCNEIYIKYELVNKYYINYLNFEQLSLNF